MLDSCCLGVNLGLLAAPLAGVEDAGTLGGGGGLETPLTLGDGGGGARNFKTLYPPLFGAAVSMVFLPPAR